ncbi:MAG TPA: FecR domain-containing protein, partial [Prolixibacteraceae bacterium]|nr:FecR domain-containing protein [Prolixibacteraceae bacterium]
MEKLFSKYLHAVCTPEEFQEITNWIKQIGNNDKLSSLMHQHWENVVLHEPGHEVNHTLWQKIRSAIDEQENSVLQRRIQKYKWGLRAAAILVSALILANLLLAPLLFLNEKGGQSICTTVPNGARTNLILPDGSEVWLNSGSTLSYSTDFSSNRGVELEGEAYFKVTKSSAPFRVSTTFGQVEVTGTAFNVKTLSSENEFETTVEEGTVIVKSPRVRRAAELKTGQHARLNGSRWKLAKVETDLYTSWKDGKIIFRNENLPNVAKRLERWYNIRIELDNDPRLRKINYTGTLEMESF